MNLEKFKNIRSTEIDGIKHYSVMDAMESIGMKRKSAWEFIKRNPDISTKCGNKLFAGKGQTKQLVADRKRLWQILGKTKTAKGKMIDDKAYETLDNLLHNPEKLVGQVDKIHGAEGVAKIQRSAEYLTSHSEMKEALNKVITVEKKEKGFMIGAVQKHNNRKAGLPDKGGRDDMNKQQQQMLRITQTAQAIKLDQSDKKNWAAVDHAKGVANAIVEYLSE